MGLTVSRPVISSSQNVEMSLINSTKNDKNKNTINIKSVNNSSHILGMPSMPTMLKVIGGGFIGAGLMDFYHKVNTANTTQNQNNLTIPSALKSNPSFVHLSQNKNKEESLLSTNLKLKNQNDIIPSKSKRHYESDVFDFRTGRLTKTQKKILNGIISKCGSEKEDKYIFLVEKNSKKASCAGASFKLTNIEKVFLHEMAWTQNCILPENDSTNKYHKYTLTGNINTGVIKIEYNQKRDTFNYDKKSDAKSYFIGSQKDSSTEENGIIDTKKDNEKFSIERSDSLKEPIACNEKDGTKTAYIYDMTFRKLCDHTTVNQRNKLGWNDKYSPAFSESFDKEFESLCSEGNNEKILNSVYLMVDEMYKRMTKIIYTA